MNEKGVYKYLIKMGGDKMYKELTIEDFAELISKMTEADKLTAYNVLVGMILSKESKDLNPKESA